MANSSTPAAAAAEASCVAANSIPHATPSLMSPFMKNTNVKAIALATTVILRSGKPRNTVQGRCSYGDVFPDVAADAEEVGCLGVRTDADNGGLRRRGVGGGSRPRLGMGLRLIVDVRPHRRGHCPGEIVLLPVLLHERPGRLAVLRDVVVDGLQVCLRKRPLMLDIRHAVVGPLGFGRRIEVEVGVERLDVGLGCVGCGCG